MATKKPFHEKPFNEEAMHAVLAVSPHPDDAEFGCGALLHRLQNEGHEVHVLTLTHAPRFTSEGISDPRIVEQAAALAALGLHRLHHWSQGEDGHLADDVATIHVIEDLIVRIGATWVLIPWHHDTHQDHRATSRAGISATRRHPRVWFYETPSSLDFRPSLFLPLDPELWTIKARALNAHVSQAHLELDKRAHTTATLRAIVGHTASGLAEAFVPLRSSVAF